MEPRIRLALIISRVAIYSLSSLRYAALAEPSGIEPDFPVLETGTSPLNALALWCLDVGSNHGRPALQTGALPLSYPSLVAMAGFEPATEAL